MFSRSTRYLFNRKFSNKLYTTTNPATTFDKVCGITFALSMCYYPYVTEYHTKPRIWKMAPSYPLLFIYLMGIPDTIWVTMSIPIATVVKCCTSP